MPPRILCLTTLTCAAALAFLASPAAAREKADVLIMKNGDRITCEIKKLERGQLAIKTGYTLGTIYVDWEKVERIESKQYFRVEASSGEYYTGAVKLESDKELGEKTLRIRGVSGEVKVPQHEVVVVEQLERGWMQNLYGSVDGGFSFTKSNNQTTYTLNGAVGHKSKVRRVDAKLSSTFSGQKSGQNTDRHNLALTYMQRLRGRWFSAGTTDFLRSAQQQLKLRSLFGGGVGRELIYRPATRLILLGGAAYTRELYSPDAGRDPDQNNAEGLIMAYFEMFRFDSTEVTTRVRFSPSMSVPGRMRLDFDLSFKLDLIGDLYWNLSFWNNFDSHPPVDVPRNDFGGSTTIGWSF